MKRNPQEDYVADYYQKNYDSILRDGLDDETKAHGAFLAAHVRGMTLDFGCGPSVHFNALFMPHAMTIDGIDVVPENIAFARTRMKAFRPERYRIIEDYVRCLGAGSTYSSVRQISKIRKLIMADFTKPLPRALRKKSYDCVVSTYSLGCVKTIDEFRAALQNMYDLLAPGGTMLCLNTNGKNRNAIVPEMTYQGLDAANDDHRMLTREAKAIGFKNISTEEKRICQGVDAMYRYSTLFFTSARK